MNSFLANYDLRAGLPAALLGGFAMLIVALGSGLATSDRLSESYEQREYRALQAYDAALNSDAGIDQLNTTAEEIDIINARLVGFRGDDPSQYWRWANFLERHASVLRERGEQSGDSVPEMASRLAKYEGDAQKMYAGLAAGKSEFARRAMARVSDYETARILEGRMGPSTPSVGKLRAAVEQLGSEALGQRGLEVQLRWFLAAQQLELAWPEAERLHFSSPSLEEAAKLSEQQNVPEFAGFVVLCSAFAQADQGVRADLELDGDAADWRGRYSELLQQSVRGEWNDVAFLLARKNLDRADAVRLGAARWICRLAVSEKAKRDAQWRSKYAAGVQIVLQIAPQIPELAELVWLMAREHAGAPERDAVKSVSDAVSPSDGAEESNGMAAEQSGDTQVGSDVVAESREDSADEGDSGTTKIDQTVRVPRELVEAVVGGQAVAVRHMVLAFSSMLSGKADVAGSHLQLTKRSSGTLMQIAHVALGRLRTREASDSDVASLVDLMKMVTDLEAESGLNWFVLGVAYQRQGNLLGAEASLSKADDLLPDVEAIGELLESVRSDLNRQEREKQLRPVE